MIITTPRKLSAVFDSVSKGTTKSYWIMRNGKPFAQTYDREVAEHLVSANGGEIEEREVFSYQF